MDDSGCIACDQLQLCAANFYSNKHGDVQGNLRPPAHASRYGADAKLPPACSYLVFRNALAAIITGFRADFVAN
jgi:hypothetical protein